MVVTSEVDPETEVSGTLLTLGFSGLLVGGLGSLDVAERHTVGGGLEAVESNKAGGRVDDDEITFFISLILKGGQDTLEDVLVLDVVLHVDEETSKGTNIVTGEGLNHTSLVNTKDSSRLSLRI